MAMLVLLIYSLIVGANTNILIWFTPKDGIWLNLGEYFSKLGCTIMSSRDAIFLKSTLSFAQFCLTLFDDSMISQYFIY